MVKGGAFFGFAIVVAAALLTWGIIAIVNEATKSSGGGGGGSDIYTPPDGLSEIQVSSCHLFRSEARVLSPAHLCLQKTPPTDGNVKRLQPR